MHTIKRILIKVFYTLPRMVKYNFLSTCSRVYGKPVKNGPVLINGEGAVSFGKNVNLGYSPSPFFYNSYIYIEARNNESKIEFESGVYINNNACFISEGNEGIKIGANTLMGTNVTIYDSDFHELHPGKRFTGVPETAGVSIGENVFIGSGVTILKGVQIGNNSVIGSGSVVVNSIPENVIAGGNPCRVIKSLLL